VGVVRASAVRLKGAKIQHGVEHEQGQAGRGDGRDAELLDQQPQQRQAEHEDADADHRVAGQQLGGAAAPQPLTPAFSVLLAGPPCARAARMLEQETICIRGSVEGCVKLIRFACVVAIALGLASPALAAQVAELAKAQAADPAAVYIRASGWVSSAKGPVFVELLTDKDEAAIRLRTADNATPEIHLLDTPYDALKLLADKRMQFLWQPLSEWAGPTLEPMRDRGLVKLRAAAAARRVERPSSSTVESTVRPRVRSVLQLARYLIQIGRSAEAETLLQQELAGIRFKGGTSWSGIEWFSVGGVIASARWERGDSDGTIKQYEFMERTMGASAFTPNAMISRASFLARAGRYGEALSLIDATWAAWNRDNRGVKVAGSDRQFGWIRACALEGLGRHAEAVAAFEPVLRSNDTRDPHYYVEEDSVLKVRGAACMKDSNALATLLEDQLRNDLSPDALVTLQPSFRPKRDLALWEKVRSDPALRKAASERMRELPPEMTAALNSWDDYPAGAGKEPSLTPR